MDSYSTKIPFLLLSWTVLATNFICLEAEISSHLCVLFLPWTRSLQNQMGFAFVGSEQRIANNPPKFLSFSVLGRFGACFMCRSRGFQLNYAFTFGPGLPLFLNSQGQGLKIWGQGLKPWGWLGLGSVENEKDSELEGKLDSGSKI